ncbi:NAD(P)/FAD-dependent oxidoreductase [Sphingomonas aerolata]|uniref:NAD(P)/FAD-dependent oxidoreductase n=1 Tax=Sphingomonas aerolata TaxID=185951 RepID=UPI003358E2DA
MKVAIIGAGIAGLSCALRLQQDGCVVTLFDKGRGAGGRMATRRVETHGCTIAFDHGAQYLTMRDPDFVAAMQGWAAAGVVARWPAAGPDAWVGTPGMNAIVGHLAAQTDVRWNTQVTALRRTTAGWQVDPGEAELFDSVVAAIPAEQAAGLLAPHDAAMARVAADRRSAPCWTAMFAFETPLPMPDDVLKDRGIIGWAARNSAKPGRDGPEAWVVQATPDWSRDHLEETAETVVDQLQAALAAECPDALPAPIVRVGHRWRYARAAAGEAGCLWNAGERIGAAGDWLLAPRIESGWLSGRRLAEQMLADA